MTLIDTDEEARAAEYRAQQARRAHYQAQLWDALAGSPQAQADLLAAWDPLIQYLAERDIEVDSDAEIDPIGISDTVNVGRTTE